MKNLEKPCKPSAFRLMSNNQWKCDANRPVWIANGEDCSAEARVDGLVRAYKQALPDVIGLQEVSMHMEDLMMARLRSFTTDGGEGVRYDLITGGDTPILYRCDRLLLIASGFFRYDESIPGYEGCFNNSGTKSYTYGVFQRLEDGKRFALMSTHLWWKSANPERPNYQPHSNIARACQINLAIRKMNEVLREFDCPGVIMGDFNAAMGSLCMNAVDEAGWTEAYYVTLGEREDSKGHHPCGDNGYSRTEPGRFEEAIDHIIVEKNSPIRVNAYKRITDAWFDPVSDHYPLYIDVEL